MRFEQDGAMNRMSRINALSTGCSDEQDGQDRMRFEQDGAMNRMSRINALSTGWSDEQNGQDRMRFEQDAAMDRMGRIRMYFGQDAGKTGWAGFRRA